MQPISVNFILFIDARAGRCSMCEGGRWMDQIVRPAGEHTTTEHEEHISLGDRKVDDVDGVKESDLIYFDRSPAALNRGDCDLPGPGENWGCC